MWKLGRLEECRLLPASALALALLCMEFKVRTCTNKLLGTNMQHMAQQ